MPDEDNGVALWLSLRVRLVDDRVHGGRRRGGPPPPQPGALEGVPRQRAEADHGRSSSSVSLTASVRTTGAAGSPAAAAAARNCSVALPIASSRLSASTISWAPYLLVPIPVAMPWLAATASASSTTSSRDKIRSPSASTPTLHLTGRSCSGSVQRRQQVGELLQAGQVMTGEQQVDVRCCHHHAQCAGPEVRVVAFMRIEPEEPVTQPRQSFHRRGQHVRIAAVQPV